MKKILLILVTLMGSIGVSAGTYPERVESLSAKVVLHNSQGYFVLSDRTCWKAVGFDKRWRTPREWWNGVQLVPPNYECLPKDWHIGSQIEVYQKYGNLEVNEENAANEEALKQCTHLLVNTRTGQVLFAIWLDPADFMVQLFNEAYQDGYSVGYTQGRNKSYQNATEVYNTGHGDGYKTGYADGFKDGINAE